MRLKNMYIEEIKVYSDMLDVDLPAKMEQIFRGKRFDMADLNLEESGADCTPEQLEKVRETAEWLSHCA